MKAASATKRGAPHSGSCESKGCDGCGEDEPTRSLMKGGKTTWPRKQPRRQRRRAARSASRFLHFKRKGATVAPFFLFLDAVPDAHAGNHIVDRQLIHH